MNEIKQKIQEIEALFDQRFGQINTQNDLQDIKIQFLGRKGCIQNLMLHLKELPSDERPLFGKSLNLLKKRVSDCLQTKMLDIEKESFRSLENDQSLDVTLPGQRPAVGMLHPITQMIDEIVEILNYMGFNLEEAPELESETNNYEGLNYPHDHPARDMQDTFYIRKDLLLRSHTTSIQPRLIKSQTLPIRAACVGKCYRNETITSRSHVFFHQVDLVYIDRNISFSDLLSLTEEFYSKIFRQKITLRVRPSYFPFVEPGMEIDISCTACAGSGCTLCKKTGYLEVAGAGMIHPNILEQGNIDTTTYSGYALGCGIERLIMLRHQINDIRLFTQNDMRFLSQFTN